MSYYKRCTNTGAVIYKRKKHEFKFADIYRIAVGVIDNMELGYPGYDALSIREKAFLLMIAGKFMRKLYYIYDDANYIQRIVLVGKIISKFGTFLIKYLFKMFKEVAGISDEPIGDDSKEKENGDEEET